MTKAKRKGNGNKYSKRLAVAGQAEAAAINLADDISTLAGWLRNDILSLAGGNVDTRRQLLDFVIESLRQREHLRPHRIQPVRVMLENQRDLLLAFAQEIDDRLIASANELNLDPSDMRRLFNQRIKERASDQDHIADDIPCEQSDEQSAPRSKASGKSSPALSAPAPLLRTSTAVSGATFSCAARSETAIWTYSVSSSTIGDSCAVNIPSALIKVPPNYYPAKLIRTGWNCWGLKCSSARLERP